MARYEVVIESHADRNPDYVHASVAKGPTFLHGYSARGVDGRDARDYLEADIREDWPTDTFDFLHVES